MTRSTHQPWQILHLDVSQPIPDLPVNLELAGIIIFVWWHQIPLGELKIPSSQLPLPSRCLMYRLISAIAPAVGSDLLDQGFRGPLPSWRGYETLQEVPKYSGLAALNHPLRQLQQRWESLAKLQETVSVVICTRDRPEPLSRCLQSLQSLKFQPHEILVIDNASRTDATQQLVAQFPNIRYIPEPKPGLSAARNTGLQAATGDLIAFTDDDVEVHPYWLHTLQAAFCDPKVMVMTGLVLPASLKTEAEQIFQWGLSGGFGCGYRSLTFDAQFFQANQRLGVPVWKIGAGANMAFRREIFTLVGKFDERLGAGAAGCSEDSEFWYRILAAGWTCRYEPTSVIYHHHRTDVEGLTQQMRAYMRGHVAALLVQAENPGPRHWGNLVRLGLALPSYYGRRFLKGFLHGFKGSYRTVLTEIQGYLEGFSVYLSRRKIPTCASASPEDANSALQVHSQPTSQS